jgi:hypothetical protein
MPAAGQKQKLLPPVNWRWVKEGDGYVRHEAWLHTPTVLLAMPAAGSAHWWPCLAVLAVHPRGTVCAARREYDIPEQSAEEARGYFLQQHGSALVYCGIGNQMRLHRRKRRRPAPSQGNGEEEEEEVAEAQRPSKVRRWSDVRLVLCDT